MKSLRKRIDRLLRLRDQELAYRRRELEEACAVCDAANRARSAAEAEAHAVAERNHADLTTGRSGLETHVRSSAGTAYREAAREADLHHERTRARVADAEGRVTLAWRRLRSLEILKARRLASEARETERRSQRELDEIGRHGWQERRR